MYFRPCHSQGLNCSRTQFSMMSLSYPSRIYQRVSVSSGFRRLKTCPENHQIQLQLCQETYHMGSVKGRREVDRIDDRALSILRGIVWRPSDQGEGDDCWAGDLISALDRRDNSRAGRKDMLSSGPEDAARPKVRTLSSVERKARRPPGDSSSETWKSKDADALRQQR